MKFRLFQLLESSIAEMSLFKSSCNQTLCLHPSDANSWFSALSCPDWNSLLVRRSYITDSQENDPYLRINNALWWSSCIRSFWNQSAYWWQVLRSSCHSCCQESSSRPEKETFHDSNSNLSIWFSDELTDLRRIKYTSFQLLHRQTLKSLIKVSETISIVVQIFSDLLYHTQIDVQRGELYPVSVHQRLFDEFPSYASLVCFRLRMNSVATIPHSQEVCVHAEPGLLSQEKFQIFAYKHLMLITKNLPSTYVTALYFSFSIVNE